MKEYQSIGQYYFGWCAYRKGEDARLILERVIEESDTYRVRALMTLAAVEAREGNFEAELSRFIEAVKHTDDLATFIELSKGIAVVKAKEGYHHQAVKDLESLIPLLKHAKPNVYYCTLNSLAVELGEVGRLEEASNVSGLVIASPFAPHYPEFRETYSEINQRFPRRQSVVKIGFPEPQEHEEYKPQPAANVPAFPRAKPYIPSTHLDTASLGDIDVTAIELLALILGGVLKDRATEEEINKICNTFFFALKNLFDAE